MPEIIMELDPSQEIWQVEANGQVYETSFDEMTAWIADGSLLRIDRVRKGNLRWIEAGKVPALLGFFNAKDAAEPPCPIITTTTKLGPTVLPNPAGANPTAGAAPAAAAAAAGETMCAVHPELTATLECATCCNFFCKGCPTSYGGTVKICPFCGAMCKPVEKAAIPGQISNVYYGPTEKFGFSDFGEALGYPFKHMTSLVFGSIMFMLFSLGQSATGFGGIFMMWGVIVCYMLANTLTFGVLANTVDNFSQGKIGGNFMPSFDDFSLWDDVVHPLFLMIGVHISTFGPLAIVIILALFFIVAPVTQEISNAQSAAPPLPPVAKELPYAANAARQSQEVRDLLQKNASRQQQRVAEIENGLADGVAPESDDSVAISQAEAAREEAEIQELQSLIQETRKGQVESIVGKSAETVQNERYEFMKQLVGRGLLFVLFAGICLLWAFFYYPAACIVAAYTRSFWAAANPAVGLDTIRRLGFDYFKLLVMTLILGMGAAFVGGVTAAIFAPFDLPTMGNLPATAVSALFSFYFAVVFACVVGFLLYKNAEKLRLYR